MKFDATSRLLSPRGAPLLVLLSVNEEQKKVGSLVSSLLMKNRKRLVRGLALC